MRAAHGPAISSLYLVEMHLTSLATAQSTLAGLLSCSHGPTVSNDDVLAIAEEVAGHGAIVLDALRRIVAAREALLRPPEPDLFVTDPVPLNTVPAGTFPSHSQVRAAVWRHDPERPALELLDRAWGGR